MRVRGFNDHYVLQAYDLQAPSAVNVESMMFHLWVHLIQPIKSRLPSEPSTSHFESFLSSPHDLYTFVPSAGSNNFHSHFSSLFSLCSLSFAMILFAISSKFSVARARIVGPAPERHTPRKPFSVLGDIDSTISVRPGIRVWR